MKVRMFGLGRWLTISVRIQTNYTGPHVPAWCMLSMLPFTPIQAFSHQVEVLVYTVAAGNLILGHVAVVGPTVYWDGGSELEAMTEDEIRASITGPVVVRP